jgi:alpha-tubulin suppressor-like RCC1 family protein
MRVGVSVNAVPVAAVELAPQRVEVEAGQTAPLTITARDAKGAVLRDRAPNWISSNEDVARVSAAGIVTGVAAGEARITARIEGKEATVAVRVRPAAVNTVAVNPPAVTLNEGEGTMLSATPRDAQGAPLPDRRVQWRSDNARVATVSNSGEVKALSAGTARITASAEEKLGTVTITVNARPPVVVTPPPTPTPTPPRDTAEPVITRPTPTDPGPGAAGLVATRLSAGGKHTCAIARAGVAICWGANERGQLGTAAGQSSTGPVRNPDIRGLTAIVSGAQHTCGLREDGSAICWGGNDKGQLGAATPGRQLSADAVTVAGGRTFTALTAGDRHTCGLAADGAAWCWGDNSADQLGTGASGPTPALVRGGKKFTVLAAGSKHTCGVGTDGAVLCWGDGFSGQLGRGARETSREPVAVDLSAKATDVASGRDHACAVAVTGRVWCWGGNRAGEVGDGGTSERLSPKEAQTPRGTRFTSVVAGADFTCALAEGGEAYCWGGNRSGQLGDGSRTNRPAPVAVQAPFPFATIVAGEAHACGLPRGRLPVCWGANAQGQLGDGTVEPRAQPTPVSLDSLRRP